MSQHFDLIVIGSGPADGEVQEHYYTSLVDMVRASWSVRKTRDFHPESRRTASLDSHRTFFPTSNFADTIRCCD
jgi:hypothetical protein